MKSKFDLEVKSRREETVKRDKEVYKTEGGVFNKRTLEIIGKLGTKGIVDRIMGPIATGKEADVFLGVRGGSKIAIKIFRLSSASYFKKPTVLQYIQGDRRFTNIKKSGDGLVMAWVLKEFRNLKRAEELGLNSPKPIAMEKNIIVMEFLGDGDDCPAPPLLKYDIEDPKDLFSQIVTQVKKFYKGEFVHADLSEYNILMHDNKPYLIDFGQAVPLTHPKAEEFLERDVQNICTFFNRWGVDCNLEKTLKIIRNA